MTTPTCLVKVANRLVEPAAYGLHDADTGAEADDESDADEVEAALKKKRSQVRFTTYG